MLLSIAPGAAASGASVTLQGSNFYLGATVSVGGQPLLNVVVVNGSSITGTLPAGLTPGSVAAVVVTNASGRSSQTQALDIISGITVVKDGPPRILDLQPVPQPDPRCMAIQLSAPADGLRLRLWTKSMALVATLSHGAAPAGWQTVAFPGGFFQGLPNGTYFVTAEADQGASKAFSARPCRLILVR